MSRKSTCVFSIVAGLLFAIPVAAQQKDLTYNTVTPCFILNTFAAGGQFAANETRIYNVVGSGSLAGQGGSASGCSVPGFSNGIARVQAVAINVVVLNPTGGGHVWAVAADAAITGSTGTFMNFPAAPPGSCCISASNTGPVAVAQTSSVGDIKIQVAGSGAHVLASVVGYYTRFGETITVGPGATPAASGTALLNALTSIADNSAAKPYLIKLEPGIYDVGTTMLAMKPFVDIEGSGQLATTIQGQGNADELFLTGVVKGASSAELRNLRVKSTGSPPSLPYSIGVVIFRADTRLRDVTIVSSGGTFNEGVQISNDVSGLNPLLDRVTVDAQGGTGAYGIVNEFEQAKVAVRDSIITVSNTANGWGIYTQFAYPSEIARVRVNVSASGTAYGFYLDSLSLPGSVRITDSNLTASGAFTSYGIYLSGGNGHSVVRSTVVASGGSNSYGIYLPSLEELSVDHCEITGATYVVFSGLVRIGATRLNGGPVFGSATCAGVYDENYTFFASTCP